MPVDYDALAAQHGGTATVDYDALASEAGGSAAAPASVPEVATIRSGEPKGFLESAQQWAENVGNDLKHGTDITGIGSVLKKMGAHGVYNGNSQAVGDFMASLPLGLAKMAQGGVEIPQSGKTWQGTKDVVGGALQAATMPASFVAPEAPGAAAEVGNRVAGAVKAALPSAERAGQLFGQIAQDANKIPVNLENAGDAALRLMDWQKKTQLGPTLNKFLNRITNPKLGSLTYEEARDFYQLLGKMSVDETNRIPPAVRRDLVQMTVGLKQDIGTAAETVGRGADYYEAMGQYAKAARLKDWYEAAKLEALKAAKIALPAGAGGYAAKKMLDSLNQ